MSIEEKILRLLFEPVNKYKGVPVSFFGIPDLGIYKKQSIRNSIFKLKQKGFISTAENKAFITNAGRKHVERRIDSFQTFENTFKKGLPKTLIVMYDIPEAKKAEREWFRFHLRKFGYEMIQRSVWVGPAPLPKEFVDYAKSLDLHLSIKALRLAKPYGEESFKF